MAYHVGSRSDKSVEGRFAMMSSLDDCCEMHSHCSASLSYGICPPSRFRSTVFLTGKQGVDRRIQLLAAFEEVEFEDEDVANEYTS